MTVFVLGEAVLHRIWIFRRSTKLCAQNMEADYGQKHQAKAINVELNLTEDKATTMRPMSPLFMTAIQFCLLVIAEQIQGALT